MKRPILIITSLIFVIIMLFGVRIFASNRISTSGVVLGKTEEDLAYYKSQNIMLKEKVFTLSSLSHIASAATKLGFVEGSSDFALSKSLPLALKR